MIAILVCRIDRPVGGVLLVHVMGTVACSLSKVEVRVLDSVIGQDPNVCPNERYTKIFLSQSTNNLGGDRVRREVDNG